MKDCCREFSDTDRKKKRKIPYWILLLTAMMLLITFFEVFVIR